MKQEAGCTEDGVMRYTCVSCHATREENITATGHQYTKTVVDPTCTSSGYEQYLCFACGYEYHDHFTAPLGHDYEAVLTEPTCTEQGYTTHTCSRCEDHYVDGYVEALGHAWGEWTKEIAEDCFHPGVEVRTCAHSARPRRVRLWRPMELIVRPKISGCGRQPLVSRGRGLRGETRHHERNGRRSISAKWDPDPGPAGDHSVPDGRGSRRQRAIAPSQMWIWSGSTVRQWFGRRKTASPKA